MLSNIIVSIHKKTTEKYTNDLSKNCDSCRINTYFSLVMKLIDLRVKAIKEYFIYSRNKIKCYSNTYKSVNSDRNIKPS